MEKITERENKAKEEEEEDIKALKKRGETVEGPKPGTENPEHCLCREVCIAIGMFVLLLRNHLNVSLFCLSLAPFI